jgi:predicted nucleotidyltransferase
MRMNESFGRSAPAGEHATELVRRAGVQEAERQRRREDLRRRARSAAERIHGRWGRGVRVFLFGSVRDPDLFSLESDLDLAVHGLSPEEYWDAWAEIEICGGDARMDFVRVESASESLRERITREGELL